jgi:hypothetical protein
VTKMVQTSRRMKEVVRGERRTEIFEEKKKRRAAFTRGKGRCNYFDFSVCELMTVGTARPVLSFTVSRSSSTGRVVGE